MIPILYDKTGKIKLGELVDIIDSGYVEEERNGIFELTIDYPVGYPLSDLIVEENMIETKSNEEQGLQKFRIYDTKRLMKNVISVFARHESFDLANDHVENVNLENASCEYALNTLFRNSHFSTHYRGYSDIINAQNYKIDNVNILNAIAGKEGSIIDTYGTGAEILRDGTNIHVLNKRGHDNEVTIEFGKNLTDFVLERDLTDLETRVGGFAKYTPEGGKETIVKSNWIDSSYIDNFAHPYISVEGRRDYSDKFKDGEIPTVEKLNKLCADEFKINKRDIPKSNYTIKFIPLSKCVGYEGIQDKISLCDTVRIIDKRFNVDTKAKVIKYKYDFIKERYKSMELGEPRTTLGDIIGGGGTQGPPGKDGAPGKDGVDGNIGDFPDSLPTTPILTANVKGWGSIDLSWTFEDKVYYTYELYASKNKDFIPNIFDLIHSGQSSSHLFQAKPGETWYFKVCAKNTHASRTEFSPQVTITTKKSDDFEEYFSTLGVGNLVANIFSADYMEAGIIKANWVEFKGASIVDGNGKRTFDVDSFGRVTIMPSVFRLLIDGQEQEVATQNSVNDKISKGEAITDINITQGNIKIKANKIDLNGVTTAGNLPDGRYVKIENETYTAYNDNIKVLEQGVRNWSGRQVPAMYMGANGFKSGSTGTDGTYFAMFNFPSVNGNPAFQHLGLRNAKTGLWSVIEFNDQGVMSIRPEMNLNISGPEFHLMSTNVHFEGKTHFTQVIDARYINCTGMRAGGSVKFPFGAVFDDNGRTAIQKAPTGDDLGVLTTCLYPKFDAVQYLGNSSFRWRQLYCTTAPDISSDISLKENIEYTDEKSIIPQFINLVDAETITYRDMYEFYRDVYRSAEYNYIGSDEKVLGIIAQDMINTKVGDKIIRHNKDGKLSYSQETRVTVLEGALKEAINEIEYWKGKYIDLESKVDFIMEKLK